MRPFRAAAALAVAAVLLPGVALAVPPPAVGTGAVTYDAAGTARLYVLVNAHRVAMGLPALTVNTKLESVARAWTISMATSGKLAHNDALFTKAMHRALGIERFGENVAYASLGVERAHVVLLNSPHHRENIESRVYAVGGFAVVRDAKGITWVTEDFGSAPKALAPEPVAPKPVAARPASKPAVRTAPAAPKPAAARPAPRAPAAPAAPKPAAPATPAWTAPTVPVRVAAADRVDVPAGDVALDLALAATGTERSVPSWLVLLAIAALVCAAGFTVSESRRS